MESTGPGVEEEEEGGGGWGVLRRSCRTSAALQPLLELPVPYTTAWNEWATLSTPRAHLRHSCGSECRAQAAGKPRRVSEKLIHLVYISAPTPLCGARVHVGLVDKQRRSSNSGSSTTTPTTTPTTTSTSSQSTIRATTLPAAFTSSISQSPPPRALTEAEHFVGQRLARGNVEAVDPVRVALGRFAAGDQRIVELIAILALQRPVHL